MANFSQTWSSLIMNCFFNSFFGVCMIFLKYQSSLYVFMNKYLEYFGHLMQRADSLEKTLMLGRIEGSRIAGEGGDRG